MFKKRGSVTDPQHGASRGSVAHPRSVLWHFFRATFLDGKCVDFSPGHDAASCGSEQIKKCASQPESFWQMESLNPAVAFWDITKGRKRRQKEQAGSGGSPSSAVDSDIDDVTKVTKTQIPGFRYWFGLDRFLFLKLLRK